jgi:dethiobiotin synthase
VSDARRPGLPDGVRRAFRLASGRPRVEAEVDAEVAFHLEMRAAELVARGWTTDAARAEAVRRFGDPHQWSMAMSAVDRERAAEQRRAEWLDDLRQDLRYGLRSLRRAPLFSLLAVVTLALGIGANAAVFGVVKSVLLDALPYADADRVVRVYSRWRDGTNDRGPFSAGMVQDLRERNRSFERLAAYEGIPRDAVFSGGDAPRAVRVAWTEPELFRTLGVAAARGRVLRADDAGADTAWNVVVTHAAWRQLLGGDPAAVGRRVPVNGIPRTVVGVLPAGFVGPVGEVDFYFPRSLRGDLRDPVRARSRQFLGLVGRLRPGVTQDAGRRDLAAIGAAAAREHPGTDAAFEVAPVPIRDALVGDTRTPLLVLLASAGLVLAITCANLAGALLSRTLTRRRSSRCARRSAPAGDGSCGSSSPRARCWPSPAGGPGVLLAAAGLGAVRGLARTALPPYADLALDPGALLVTGALAVAAGVAFGLAPALSVGRANVQGTLRDEGRGASEGRRARHLRGVLVAGQMALCVTLLAGAGLLARSLLAMAAAPLGFAPDRVLAAAVQLPPGRPYNDAAARVRFMDRLEARLRALPGVTAVAATGEIPTRTLNRNGFTVEGAPPAPTDAPNSALYETVTDDYFRALGIALRAGRTFGPQDRPDGPPVVIVSEGLARRHWPGGNAVGGRLRFGADAPWMEVVGVVADVANDPTRLRPSRRRTCPSVRRRGTARSSCCAPGGTRRRWPARSGGRWPRRTRGCRSTTRRRCGRSSPRGWPGGGCRCCSWADSARWRCSSPRWGCTPCSPRWPPRASESSASGSPWAPPGARSPGWCCGRAGCGWRPGWRRARWVWCWSRGSCAGCSTACSRSTRWRSASPSPRCWRVPPSRCWFRYAGRRASTRSRRCGKGRGPVRVVPRPHPVAGPGPAAPLRLAVTGTDTGVGKTLVTGALVAALRARGLTTRAMKPVETGVAGPDAAGAHADTDAARLHRAAGGESGGAGTLADVCPVTYAEPLAPMVAAERAGRPVDWGAIEAARGRLDAGAGAFVVEGAGGLLVPLGRDPDGGAVIDLATLARRWALDLVVVAADRLGVLNHALLTVREAERRGLRVRAVVLNAVRPAPADAAEVTNLGALRALLPGVPVVPFAFVAPERRDDLAHLAERGAPLAALLGA